MQQLSPSDPPPARGRVIVITGAMASGKSTVAELLARRLPRSAHVRGDAFRKMMINGRAEMTPDPEPEAKAQLSLRYELASHVADTYAAHGFDAIVQDMIIGSDLASFIDLVHSPERYLVVLSPTVSALEWRIRQREKPDQVWFSPGAMDTALRNQTAHIGYWLDSSTQTPEETVDDILSNLDKARV